MKSQRAWGVLVRQLLANDAYVVRRALVECAAALLAPLGRVIPGAAEASIHLDPTSPRGHRVLEARACRRGDVAEAAHHAAAATRVAHNTRETSILTTLRNTLGRRRCRGGPEPPAPSLEPLLDAGRFEQAAGAARAAAGSPAAQADALVQVASAARSAGRVDTARALLESARRLDPGCAAVWRELGRLALSDGEPAQARACLERGLSLDPTDVATRVALGEAWKGADANRAQETFLRALERDPECDAALLGLESLEGNGTARELRLSLGAAPLRLARGDRFEVDVRVSVLGGTGALYVLEPFGMGLASAPRGRMALQAGEHRLTLRVHVLRPDAVNGGRPWPLCLALCAGERIARAKLAVEVPDEEPGCMYYVITEDHELYDEREETGPQAARTTLVEKSRLAERIANAEGAPWTHVVDVASLSLVAWAADCSRTDAWRAVYRECADHLAEAVENGNDLGLHMHAFHDPAGPVFAHGFDEERDVVTTNSTFLETPLPERGFWSRAYPALGDTDAAGSRAWATWRGIGRLEALGRLGDPRFRVTLFRAGSYDLGDDAGERGRSLGLLRRLGILADSNVPKPRLYHRLASPSAYPVSDDPRRPEGSPAAGRLLEIRPEFNIESDFLSDVHVLNRYVDRRAAETRRDDGSPPAGVRIVCAMTHDKFINWRMGKHWDSLDPGYGDWNTIREHLRHVGQHHPEIRFATAREAILAWYEHCTPELLAFREEEIVELSTPEADTQIFRYPIRLVGRDIPVGSERTHWVAIHAPAWLEDRIRELWIECDGERWPARPLAVGPPALEFPVDRREGAWELVVRAQAGDGITAQASPRDARILRLVSAHGYRRATVDVSERFDPDGIRRRIRNVRLVPAEDHFETTLDLSAPRKRAGRD
jgi:tetratricopeptide (TPR) repeat protein